MYLIITNDSLLWDENYNWLRVHKEAAEAVAEAWHGDPDVLCRIDICAHPDIWFSGACQSTWSLRVHTASRWTRGTF